MQHADQITLFETSQSVESKIMINDIELTMDIVLTNNTALDPELAVSPIDNKIKSFVTANIELQLLMDLLVMKQITSNY